MAGGIVNQKVLSELGLPHMLARVDCIVMDFEDAQGQGFGTALAGCGACLLHPQYVCEYDELPA